MKKPTTIVAVDDHPLIRQAIKSLVADRGDMVLVGEGSAGEHLLPLVVAHRPDVVVLDLNMPQFAAPDRHTPQDTFVALPLIAYLHQEYPETAVIILSQYLTPSLAQSIVASNVKGYLLKSDDLSLKLLEAINLIKDGGVFFSDAVREALIQKDEEAPLPVLTRRQKDILTTIAQSPNDSYAQHADALGIAESTLRNHLTNVFKALDVNNITAALIRSMKLGILSAPKDEGEV